MSFQAFRSNGGPTYYDAIHIPFEADLITSGLIFCFCILAFSFLLILPGESGKDKIYTFVRVMTSLYIGAVILVSNFAMTWDTAETSTRTKYKAGTGQEVNVSLKVMIGFRGVNITMKGEKDQIKGETIDYNEHFNWEGLQGRLGFGPFAGQFNQDYRAAQFRGLPLPILWVAEYFTLDGEGIRWGRHYRQAGWYAHIVLWLAFPLWILSNILFFVLLRYGAYFLALTGLSMVTANIIWATYRNVIDLVIPFTEHDKLDFQFGGSFWVCLITGCLCVILGIVIFLLDKLCPGHIAVFFGVDILQDSENILVEEEEEPLPEDKVGPNSSAAANSSDDVESNEAVVDEDDDDELYGPPPSAPLHTPGSNVNPSHVVVKFPNAHKVSYRTGEHRLTKRLQRPRRRTPPPVPMKNQGRESESDNEDYQNAPAKRAAVTGASSGSREDVQEDDLYENSSAIPMQAVATRDSLTKF